MGIAIVKLDSFKRAFQGILEVQAGAVHNYEKDGDIPRMHFQCQLKISKGDTRSLNDLKRHPSIFQKTPIRFLEDFGP